MRWAATLILLVVTLTPAIADEDAARYFTRRAREALAEGNHAEAEKQFAKALGEEAGFLPAIFGLAETARAKGDRDSAIGFLEQCLDEAKGCVLSSEEADVVRRAQDLLKELDRARLEYRKLLGNYVDALLGLARDREEKDPELARRCVDRILRLDKGHAEAREILKRLGGSAPSAGTGPAASADPAAAPADNETVLFAGKALVGWQGINSRWTVEGGLLVGNIEDGAYFINHKDRIEGDYTLSFEVRARKDGESPLISVIFGVRATYDRFDFGIFGTAFAFTRYDKSKDRTFIDRTDFYKVYSNFDRSEWHTYEVKVEGTKVTTIVDGKEIFTHEAEEGAYAGMPGLVVQDCTVDVRRVSVKR